MFGGSNTSSIGVWMSRELYTTLFLVDTVPPNHSKSSWNILLLAGAGNLKFQLDFSVTSAKCPAPTPTLPPNRPHTVPPPAKKKRTLTNLPKCSGLTSLQFSRFQPFPTQPAGWKWWEKPDLLLVATSSETRTTLTFKWERLLGWNDIFPGSPSRPNFAPW